MHLHMKKYEVCRIIEQKGQLKNVHPSECLISYHDNHGVERIALVVLLLTSNGKVSLFLPSPINTSRPRIHYLYIKRDVFSDIKTNRASASRGRRVAFCF